MAIDTIRLYRDGQLVQSQPSAASGTFDPDTGLGPGQTYTYTTRSYDSVADEESPDSPPVQVTTETVSTDADARFAARSVGAYSAFNFQDAQEVSDYAIDGQWSLDPNIKRSGAGGLRIELPDDGTTWGYDWWRPLADDFEPFGSAETITTGRNEYYMAYSIYIPASYYDWLRDMNGTSAKKFGITSHTPSNARHPTTGALLNMSGNSRKGSSVTNEVVTTDGHQEMWPQCYVQSRGQSAGAINEFPGAFGFNQNDFARFNLIDEGPQAAGAESYPNDDEERTDGAPARALARQYGPHAGYGASGNSWGYGSANLGQPRSAFAAPHPDPAAAGVPWKVGWNHVKCRVKFPTTWLGTDGLHEFWLGHDGDDDYTKLWSTQVLFDDPAEIGTDTVPWASGINGWYHVGHWFTPFCSGGVAETGVRPDTYLVYDERIVSPNDIDWPNPTYNGLIETPSDIAAMPPGTWARVPNSAMTNARQDPDEYTDWNGSTSANYNETIGNNDFSNSFNWVGACYHTGRDWFMMGLLGGHRSYHANVIPYFDMNTLTWGRLTNDSEFPGTRELGQDPWPDGRPCARHSYQVPACDPDNDILYQGPGGWSTSSSGTAGRFWRLDLANLTDPATATPAQLRANGDEWTLIPTGPTAFNDNAGVVDTRLGRYHYLTTSPADHWWYDPSTNQWTEVNAERQNQMGFCCYVPSQQAIWDIGRFTGTNDPGPKFRVFDLSDSGYAAGCPRSEPGWTGSNDVVNKSRPGFDWDTDQDAGFCWIGDTDVYELTTGREFIKHTANAANLVSPPVFPSDSPGTTADALNGKWAYSTTYKCFVLVTQETEDVHIYKPPVV